MADAAPAWCSVVNVEISYALTPSEVGGEETSDAPLKVEVTLLRQ